MPNNTVVSPSSHGGEERGMAIAAGAIVAVTILIYVLFSLATIISGGSTGGGIVSVINPKNWIAAFSGGFYPWKLVGGSGVGVIVWWIVLIVEMGLVGAAAYWGWMFYKGGRVHILPHSMGQGASGDNNPFPKTIHLASVDELRPLWSPRHSTSRYPQQGILLGKKGGKELRTDGETSVFVVGPTRSGKTTSLIVPNLLDWGGSVVATSTKAELVNQTAAARQRIGPTWVYDPTAELEDQGIKSVTYSPLAGCENIDTAISTARALSRGLMAGGGGGGNDWSHWYDKTVQIITPCLYAAAHAGLTMENVRDWVMNNDMSEVEEILTKRVQDSERSLNKAMRFLNSVLNLVDREQSSSFSTAQRVVQPWLNDHIVDNSASNDYDPVKLLTERGTLYLCTPADKPQEVASLFVAILEKTIVAAYRLAKNMPNERLEIPLLLALDELANVCPVERLDSIASSGAGRGVLCLTIVQDYSQLITAYKEAEAQTIWNNHPAKLFLHGISDGRTLEMISKLVGSGEVTSVSFSQGEKGSGSKTYSTQERALAGPERIQRLGYGLALLVHKGLQPAAITLIPFFNHPRYNKMVKKVFFKNTDYIQDENEEEEYDDNSGEGAKGLGKLKWTRTKKAN